MRCIGKYLTYPQNDVWKNMWKTFINVKMCGNYGKVSTAKIVVNIIKIRLVSTKKDFYTG